MSFIKIVIHLFILIYLSGRITLIIHEYVGHGIPAYFVCKEIVDIHISFFGDAWIQFRFGEATSFLGKLFVYSGGILSEVVLSCIILFVRFKKTFPHPFRIITKFIASVMLVHAFVYSINALYYNYGDGPFFNELWPSETNKLIVNSLMVTVMVLSFILSYKYSPYLLLLLQLKKSYFAITKIAVAGVMAVSIHTGLTYYEMNMVDDKVQAEIFKPEFVDKIEIELSKPENLTMNETQKKQVVQDMTPLNINFILFPCLAGAMLLGYVKSEDLVEV